MKSIFTFFFTLVILLSFTGTASFAQMINMGKGWKFKAGDSMDWSQPEVDDSSWQSIAIGQSWESQGNENYDGFGWYRIRIVKFKAQYYKTFNGLLTDKLVFL